MCQPSGILQHSTFLITMGFVIKCLLASVLVLHGLEVEAASMRNTKHRVMKRNTGAGCVSSCSGISDGFYQSCTTCAGFVTCSNGQTFEMPCAPGTVWDNSIMTCNVVSTTCTEPSTSPCITSCEGLGNGDYQSCIACNVYATCSNGILYDNRPCATSQLVWDDNVKRCEYESDTCTP